MAFPTSFAGNLNRDENGEINWDERGGAPVIPDRVRVVGDRTRAILPEANLSFMKKGIYIVHLADLLDLTARDLSGNGYPPSVTVDGRVEETLGEHEEPSLCVVFVPWPAPSIEPFLQDLDRGAFLPVDCPEDLAAQQERFSLIGLRPCTELFKGDARVDLPPDGL